MPTERVARLRGVCQSYRDSGPGPGALEGVDLDLEAGELVAFLGANGAGKTTLLRILAGVLLPTAGTVQVLGFDSPAKTAGRAARTWRGLRSYLTQDTTLDPEMTGEEILRLFATLYGVPRATRQERVEQLVETFDLSELLQRRVNTYSGGQRRRLHLATGLLHDPRLLLLDEPVAGLDLSGGDRLWDELQQRTHRGSTVVVISHDLERVKRRAKRAVLLRAGGVVADGKPQEVLVEGSPAMEDLRSSANEPAAQSRGRRGGGGRRGRGGVGGGRGRGGGGGGSNRGQGRS